MKNQNTKVVILCGGMGTRLREETTFKPKPLVEIGGKPILWHIMKIYSHFGYNDFVLCLGYKGDMIKNYFLNFEKHENDFTLNMKTQDIDFHNGNSVDWRITFAETGDTTFTGGRIKRIEKYIEEDLFLATYGDGVADIDISALLKHHKHKKKIATLTALHPRSKFGLLNIDNHNTVTYFKEKPIMKDWVSGGFFVFDKEFFNYLDDNCILERDPMEKLVEKQQLTLFHHSGFWGSMDTYKDVEFLRDLWKKEQKWKVWNK